MIFLMLSNEEQKFDIVKRKKLLRKMLIFIV